MEYDGTDFNGYQAQGKGERTVQTVLEEAIALVVNHSVSLHAAGRTDTGVHALGQVVSFRTTGSIPTDRLAIALTSLLPYDVAVVRAEQADEGFHARFSAKSRTYAYLISTRRIRSAILGRYCLHCKRVPDLEIMRQTAVYLVGTHDFAAYAKGGDTGPTTVRDVQQLSIRKLSNDRVLFVITANGFLRSMVRNIVGALLQAGVGELSPYDIRDILETRDRSANPVAPVAPNGLCLWRVQY